MSDLRYQVDVSVATRFLAEQSQPEHNRFAFAYTITVSNNGSLLARLLSRHWVITDGDGHVEHVRGEGVVGQQPMIDAGKRHSYSSGLVMTTQVGTLQGTYQMLAEDGARLDANLKPVRLPVP